MNVDRASKITRRSLLAAGGGIVAVAMGRAGEAEELRPPAKMSEVQQEFERLIPLWQEERKQYVFSSHSDDAWQGPHGKAIIALGPGIIPLLIRELKAGDHFFTVPLARIVKVDITNGNYQSAQASAKLWVEWFEATKTR